MQRESSYIAWGTIIFAVAALLLAWQYIDYRSASHTLPQGMTMGGLAVEGMTREQALNALAVDFATPLRVTYQEQQLTLPPSSVDLRYNAQQTAANLDAAVAGQRGLNGFMAHVLRTTPRPINVAVAVDYSEDGLSNFLTRVADKYDHPPQKAVPLPASLTFRPAQPGSELDIEASRRLLANALLSATVKQVDLVVKSEEAPPMRLDLLEQMLRSQLENHAGLVTSVFVKDLQNGDELRIRAEVAYSGLSILKIPILEETYRHLDHPPDPETTNLISKTMLKSGNFTANLLLRDIIGEGDTYRGVEKLTASMNTLGLKNTFMAAPYDEEEGTKSTIVTTANSRNDIDTNPDPAIQTTPLDTGALLEMIYQCSHGGGALMVAYPNQVTADECKQMIEWLSRNRIDSLIETGVPAGTNVAHKEGFGGDTHADAGIVFSPGGDFVLVVFLYRPQWLEWDESEPLVTNISTATYNYFNPVQ